MLGTELTSKRNMIYKLNKFACPECNSDFDFRNSELICKRCSARYPVINDIPRFVAQSNNQIRTSERFGYKWQKNKNINKHYEKNFLDEIKPLDNDFFKNKTILDAGCGIGIPSYCMYAMGAKEICSFDISNSIDIARENINNPASLYAQADIYKIPFRKKSFDIVVCVAVLQHLPDKKKAVDNLLDYVKPGGTLILWVYGKEGNGFVRFFVEPFRKIISRNLPISITHAISIPLGVIFHLFAKFTKYAKLDVFLYDYLVYRGEFPLKNNIEMVFDQLLAPLSYFFTREELESYLKERTQNYTIRMHNGNSWTAIAKKV